MRAALALAAWVGVGLVVGLRGTRPAWERVLAVAFWPFFLVGGARAAAEADPVHRLRAALSDTDPAVALVDELAAAIRRLRDRVVRLDDALAAVPVGDGSDPALDEARQRSRTLLVAAREREQRALDQARAAVEEAATQLWLLREAGDRGEIDTLLGDLASRLRASEEVAGGGPDGRVPGPSPRLGAR